MRFRLDSRDLIKCWLNGIEIARHNGKKIHRGVPFTPSVYYNASDNNNNELHADDDNNNRYAGLRRALHTDVIVIKSTCYFCYMQLLCELVIQLLSKYQRQALTDAVVRRTLYKVSNAHKQKIGLSKQLLTEELQK